MTLRPWGVVAIVVCLVLGAATVWSQEQQAGEDAIAAVVKKFVKALAENDVDAAVDCMMFPLLVFEVADDPAVPPNESRFDTEQAAREELQKLGAVDITLQECKVAYRRGAIAAAVGKTVIEGTEADLLFLLAKNPAGEWQIKVLFVPQ